jgi:hypothetical protein
VYSKREDECSISDSHLCAMRWIERVLSLHLTSGGSVCIELNKPFLDESKDAKMRLLGSVARNEFRTKNTHAVRSKLVNGHAICQNRIANRASA